MIKLPANFMKIDVLPEMLGGESSLMFKTARVWSLEPVVWSIEIKLGQFWIKLHIFFESNSLSHAHQTQIKLQYFHFNHGLRSGGREANSSVYRGKCFLPMAVLFAVLALAFLLKTVLVVVPASVSTSTYSKKFFYSCTDYVSYRYVLIQNSRNKLLFLDFTRQNTRERTSLAY